MRYFDEADQKKKNARIQIQENPGNLSKGVISQLEDTVKSSLKEGYLPCAVAWKIAKEANVPKIAVGEITDRLGIRITNCQIGCFKVNKTIHDNTCTNVFDLARQFKLKPIDVANEVNIRDFKIHDCQLGCF